MPIYEFRCNNCQRIFEQFCFSSEEKNQVECPECGGHHAERVLSTFCSHSRVGNGVNSTLSSSCASPGGFS